MNPNVSEWLNLLFRWIHVVAGILWIGHLYFFNFVNAQLAKTYDADSKKKVVPQLMPRALYWFRWGAAYTWISGILLLGIAIYMGGAAVTPESGTSVGAAAGIGLGSLVVGFLVYELLWKGPLGKNEPVAAGLSWVAITVAGFALGQVMTGRAVFIHIGSILGTIMAANVWMRIWPSQRKIIAAIRDGNAPDAAVVALAGLRSKHNTYMSVPLVLFMVSTHYPTVYGHDYAWALAGAIILVGWGATKLLYEKSASAAPNCA